MTIKIDRKIVGLDTDTGTGTPKPAPQADIIHMHERIKRPAQLPGSTYKIKTPLSEHAYYVTINDVVLNQGTEHEQRRPFEIFINSKNMEHYQWIVALTLILSAVFRKGGDVTFLIDELRSVFDPKGGYFKKKRLIPSLVAEIGDVIETHMRSIGLIEDTPLAPSIQDLIAQKRTEHQADHPDSDQEGDFPRDAELCNACTTQAVVVRDNCKVCLNCGDSKC